MTNNEKESAECEKCVTLLGDALSLASPHSKAARLLHSLNHGRIVRMQRRQSSTAFSTTLKDFGELHIQCRQCDTFGVEGNARAFVVESPGQAQPYSIVVCANRIRTLAEMQQVLTHELIHIFDVHRLELDLRQCSSLAYSEVRAAREAECGHTNDRNLKECARGIAAKATMNIFPWKGGSCVNSVLDKAFLDQRPFATPVLSTTPVATSPRQKESNR